MIDFEKRAMTEYEDKYTFRQSAQICNQTGFIGYLRADMDKDGNSFYSTWNGWRDDLKTQEFKVEFDEVINSLREEGAILYNRAALSKYCHLTPQARMNTEQKYYGVRVDTKDYAYLLRLNPNMGEYNLYCYCYRRDWLDSHIKQAQRGIRFITPHYKEKFRIPDGDKIRITFSDGKQEEFTCRYIDDYHLEVGNLLYHICEFAERMEQNGNRVVPLRSSLPELCYAVSGETGKVIIIKKGETGYYKTDIPTKSREESHELADEYNKKLGLSKPQATAMYWGSVYGFDTPGADPKQYDADGIMIKLVRKDRDAR